MYLRSAICLPDLNIKSHHYGFETLEYINIF